MEAISIQATTGAVITTGLRLNKPRYTTLYSIMKKDHDFQELSVSLIPYLTTLKMGAGYWIY